MNQDTFRRLISGENNSLGAKLLRLLLRGISWIYTLIIFFRNKAYDLSILKSHKVPLPVISVGNITAGGTGKTPLVMWICNLIDKSSLKCAVISRGYKSVEGTVGDEPAMLARNCPNAKVMVNSNRVYAAQKLTEKNCFDAIVLDDAFQHRKIFRDIDIVAVDATCPFGYNKILPAGLLREPVRAVKRAHAAVVTRSDMISQADYEILVSKLKRYNKELMVAKSTHKPIEARKHKNTSIGVDELKQNKVFAFCGIGNPEAFFESLKENDIQLAGYRSYDDHHNFDYEELVDLSKQAIECGADLMLCTQKDWVKIALVAKEIETIEFAYLAIEIDFTEGRQQLAELILSKLK